MSGHYFRLWYDTRDQYWKWEMFIDGERKHVGDHRNFFACCGDILAKYITHYC
jgi:hypothetical protein